MKRDKLYTVNKYNRPAFMRKKEANFFDGLLGSSFMNNPFNLSPLGDYTATNAQRIGLGLPLKPLSDLGDVGSTVGKVGALGKLGSSLGNIGLGAIGSAANRLFKKAFSFGYDNKLGNAVADIGNVAGDFVNFIPGAGKLAAPIVKTATDVVGGAINGLFGEKVDKEKLAGINEDISYGRNFVSNAGSYEALTPAKALTYDTKAYKGAIFNGSAGRKNAQLSEDMDWARGFIDRSHENNIHNIADNQLDDALFYSESNQSAYGGPLDTASPTGYSFLSDILLNDKTKEENKNKMSTNNFNYFGKDSNEFASGGKIHINPKNKGKFNATKKRTGKTTEELTHSSNPLTRKRAIFAQNARKWKHADGGPLNIWCRGGKFFDLGGDIQANGTDFPTGLTHIDEGLSHELNPNGGVQVGVDSQGVPNLVEEGEVIWNDYVFSDRIGLDDTTKEVFHVNKKKDITYADLAKKLEKEVKERPNDPISKAAFSAQMDKLEEQQERQKAEMEAQRAQEAFAALSPEEQTAVMQQVAQQEQAAQDAAIQEQAAQKQAMAQQQTMQPQMSPEEAQMMQQQQMMQAEPQMGQQQVMEPQAIEQPVMACGGHMYDKGGELKKAIYKLIGKNTDSEYRQWLKDNHIEDIKDAEDWENILNNEAVIKAIAKTNPAVAHAISNHYDFGIYRPDDIDKATIKSIAKGNWTHRLYNGWKGSDDPAWLELIDSWKENLGDNWEQIVSKYDDKKIAEDFKKTKSYQNTNKWLQKDPENMRRYLREVVSNVDSPEDAVRYARNFIDDNGDWIGGTVPTYAQVFGENGKGVRETYPGTYWHSAIEANRGNVARNFLVNDDGTVEEVFNDIPTDWSRYNTYNWDDPSNHNTFNYYKRPAAEVAPEKPVEDKGITPKRYAPILQRETNIGMVTPLINLGLMAAGVGRPDFTGLDRARAIASAPAVHATYQPIGNYLRYSPFDIWSAQNRLDAENRSTQRAMMNQSSPSRNAGLAALAYSENIGAGQAQRQGAESNLNQEVQKAGFNQSTDIHNSNAFNSVSQFNATQDNQANRFNGSMAFQDAIQRENARASWFNSLYGNIDSMGQNVANREREIRDRNWIARMAADGLLGNLGKSYTGQGFIKEVADGGKLKRKKNKKRGLTV